MTVDLSIPIVADKTRGYTVADVSARYRVGADKVRTWIKRGELRAINTAVACARPRFVVPPEALIEFERRRGVAAPVQQPRRRRQSTVIDYYP